MNLYLTSCVQYFALAGAMVFCGKAARKIMAFKADVPEQVTPYMLNPPPRQRTLVPIMQRK